MKERKEREKLEEEIKLLRAKTDALNNAVTNEQLYKEAIRAMSIYQGVYEDIPESDGDEYR